MKAGKAIQALIGAGVFVVGFAEPTPALEIIGAALIADALGVKI